MVAVHRNICPALSAAPYHCILQDSVLYRVDTFMHNGEWFVNEVEMVDASLLPGMRVPVRCVSAAVEGHVACCRVEKRRHNRMISQKATHAWVGLTRTIGWPLYRLLSHHHQDFHTFFWEALSTSLKFGLLN